MSQSQCCSSSGSQVCSWSLGMTRGHWSLKGCGESHLEGFWGHGQLSCNPRESLNGSICRAVICGGRAVTTGQTTGSHCMFQSWLEVELEAGRVNPPYEHPCSGSCWGWRCQWSKSAKIKRLSAKIWAGNLHALTLIFTLTLQGGYSPCLPIRKQSQGG